MSEIPGIISYLRDRIEYREDGLLFWKRRDDLSCSGLKWRALGGKMSFNSKFAGKEALAYICDGYKEGSVLGRKMKAHRAVWMIVKGEIPGEIDHINRNKLDNRIENLRSGTHADNMKNVGVRNNSTSGFAGVSFNMREGKWHSYITVNGTRINIGKFFDKMGAVAARQEAEVRYGFYHSR